MIKSKMNKLKTIKRPKKKHIIYVGKLVKPVNRVSRANTKPVNWVMDSIEIIICFLIYFLFNYMITKIDNCEIKHQPNTKMIF
jgi:hypothetical protein